MWSIQVFWPRPLLEKALPLEVIVHLAVDHIARGVLKLLLLVGPPPLRGLLTFQLGPHYIGEGAERRGERAGKGRGGERRQGRGEEGIAGERVEGGGEGLGGQRE